MIDMIDMTEIDQQNHNSNQVNMMTDIGDSLIILVHREQYNETYIETNYFKYLDRVYKVVYARTNDRIQIYILTRPNHGYDLTFFDGSFSDLMNSKKNIVFVKRFDAKDLDQWFSTIEPKKLTELCYYHRLYIGNIDILDYLTVSMKSVGPDAYYLNIIRDGLANEYNEMMHDIDQYHESMQEHQNKKAKCKCCCIL